MSSAAAVGADAEPAETPAQPKAPSPLDEFGDVRYLVDIRVGQAVRTLGQILELKVGDIIALDRPAHESVILTIEGITIAFAEVVMSEKGSSIHISEVGSEE